MTYEEYKQIEDRFNRSLDAMTADVKEDLRKLELRAQAIMPPDHYEKWKQGCERMRRWQEDHPGLFLYSCDVDFFYDMPK